jgi:DNA replicative helicase MCM subunit Mcm2 (Cdc46/Mcm family)
MTILRDYIAYARSFIHPSLSEEAGDSLVEAYVSKFMFSVYALCNFVCYSM